MLVGDDALGELEHYRMMAEATTDIVLQVSLDGVIRWVSPTITETLGWLPSDWVGKRNLDVVRPDHRARFAAEVREVVASGGDSRFEFPVVCADGTSVWMESVGRLANRDADVPYRVVRLRDITAQHEARELLAASEAMFRQAMNDAPIGMCLVAPTGEFLAVNASLCELLARDEATLQATTWQQMTHPDDVSVDQGLVDDILAGRRDTYRLRKRYLRPDGQVEWVSSSLTAQLGWQPHEWVGKRPEVFVHPDDAAPLAQRRDQVVHGAARTSRLRFRDSRGSYHWVEARAAPYRDETGTVHGVMATISVIDDLVAQERALQYQATHDDLTGLLDREEAYRQAEVVMSEGLRTDTMTFVAFIDVDNLKTVNDDFGHSSGDELLRVVAQRITQSLGDELIAARIGGDEVLVVLPGIDNVDAAVAMLNGVLSTINAPHSDGQGHELRPRVSIGLTEFMPGEDIEVAVHRADAAMYAAKANGGNHVRLISTSG